MDFCHGYVHSRVLGSILLKCMASFCVYRWSHPYQNPWLSLANAHGYFLDVFLFSSSDGTRIDGSILLKRIVCRWGWHGEVHTHGDGRIRNLVHGKAGHIVHHGNLVLFYYRTHETWHYSDHFGIRLGAMWLSAQIFVCGCVTVQLLRSGGRNLDLHKQTGSVLFVSLKSTFLCFQ